MPNKSNKRTWPLRAATSLLTKRSFHEIRNKKVFTKSKEFKIANKELLNFGLLNKNEITNFLKDRITYEEYQCSIGKDEEERKQIKNRLFKFKEN